MKYIVASLAILITLALSNAAPILAQDAAPNAAAPESVPQETKIAGDPISEQNLRDIAEMTRIANAIDSAIDAKDWKLARSFFTKSVVADFSSRDGSTPATFTPAQLTALWASDLKNDKTSFHLRGNHRVTFFGDNDAIMLSHAYEWNRIERGIQPENGGNAFWEVWGNYTHGFSRTPNGWKVNGIKFDMTAERGNQYVRNTPGS